MTTCEACTRASKNPRCGLYVVGCHGCNVRAAALSPKHIRQHIYNSIPEGKRAAFIAEVGAEYQRWADLRMRR